MGCVRCSWSQVSAFRCYYRPPSDTGAGIGYWSCVGILWDFFRILIDTWKAYTSLTRSRLGCHAVIFDLHIWISCWSLIFLRPLMYVVPHKRLVKKLQFYGIRDNTVNWIQNWLTGRTQRVVVDGESSTESPVKSGVPQGTVLGPLMFIFYINDIGKSTSSGIRLFTDDCLLYRVIRGEADARELQKDLSQLCS